MKHSHWILKSVFLILALLPALMSYAQQKETVIISGVVTDFNSHPVDSSVVQLMDRGFNPIYQTYTDKNGAYSLEVKKGTYAAMFAMRLKEYPRMNAVPEPDMRLEFWGWNIIADRDLKINPRYDKLELYGTTVYAVIGSYNGVFLYFRPMSVSKSLSYSKEIYLDKAKAEKIADLSVKLEHLKVNVYADDELLKINSIQPVQEFAGEGNRPMTAYLIQLDAPKKTTDKPYIIYRVEAENREHGEKGENIYFYEKKKFQQKPIIKN